VDGAHSNGAKVAPRAPCSDHGEEKTGVHRTGDR
jgi:hypothetical protein